MSDREHISVEPTETLVAESAWLYKQLHGCWPLWEEVVEDFRKGRSPTQVEDAEVRILKAINDDEVRAVAGSLDMYWFIELDEDVADRIACRYREVVEGPFDEEATA